MNDLRIAFRSLLKAPAFSLVAIVILALGLGASTAIFSVVHALLLSPLAYPDSGQLVNQLLHPEQGFSGVAPATFVSLAANNRVFSTLAAQGITTSMSRASTTPAGHWRGHRGLLQSFQCRPGARRTQVERSPAPRRWLCSSKAFWRSGLNSRRSIIGQQILLDDVAHTVIRVMPASFKEPTTRPSSATRCAPVAMSTRIVPAWTFSASLIPTPRSSRLAPS